MLTIGLRVARIACALVIAFVAFTCAFAADPDSPQKSGELRVSADPPAYILPYMRPVVTKQTKPERVVDRKFVAMSALAMGLTIADIESTQHCIGNGSCRELNPLMPTSRAGMYAVNIPVNAGLMYLSYRLKASGHKTWWIAPLAISGAHAVGFGFKF
jgi:hypothetical protein